MKTRSEVEKAERAKTRAADAKQISATFVDRLNRPYQQEGTGQRIISASADAHLKELKVRAATAAYNALRGLGVPVHNSRVGEALIIEQDEVFSRISVKKASFDVKFDIPFSSPEGRGVRTASIPVSYQDGDMLVGKEISYAGERYAATNKSLNLIAAAKEPVKAESLHTIVAVFTNNQHEIIGATEAAPSIVAALKTAGYRVAFRNPQDAVGIEVNEPFYEVLAGSDIDGAKKVASIWLNPQMQKTAQATAVDGDPLVVPAGTVPAKATAELENIRQAALQMEAKQAELNASIQAYAEGLVKKEGYASQAEMMQKIAEVKKQINIAADNIGAPLVEFKDGTILAKVSSFKINDAQWKTLMEKLAKVSTVAKTAVAAVTRWADLFRTYTLKHAWQEIEPGDIAKNFDKQVGTGERVKDHLSNIEKLRGAAPKGLLNEAGTSTVVKKGQLDDTLTSVATQNMAAIGDFLASVTNDFNQEIAKDQQNNQIQEEYPLPAAPTKVASKRADAPIMVSMDNRKLTDSEVAAIQSFKFSAAGNGKHWAFYRTCSKKGEEVVKGPLAKYVAMGFSEQEAFQEMKRKCASDQKYIEVFPAKSTQAQEILEQPDKKAALNGFVLADADDLTALPEGTGKTATAMVHFYLGGRLYSEKMPVVASNNRYFVDFESNIDKLS